MCDCKKVVPATMNDDQAKEFFVDDWYVHAQNETPYLPTDYNNCVRATYKQTAPSFFGYTVKVSNVAKSDSGEWKKSDILGMPFLGGQRNPESNGLAKFLVAPRFLPKWFAGDYWVLAHENVGDKDKEFAVVCGGQPTIKVEDGCTFDKTNENGSGLWIFTRKQERISGIVDQAKQIISRKGISIQELNDVNQCGCDY